MHTKSCLIFLLCILSLALGCASESKKPTGDALSAIDAYDRIDAIKKAYEAKDGHLIRQDAPDLAEQIIHEFNFETAELTFDPRLVKITDASILVNLDWQGSWSTVSGKKAANSGVAKFILNRETMALTAIEGDNPFLMPRTGR